MGRQSTCKECKFWDKYDRECCKITQVEKYSYPKKDNFILEVIYLDDQGLDVKLKTGPDFRCASFCR